MKPKDKFLKGPNKEYHHMHVMTINNFIIIIITMVNPLRFFDKIEEAIGGSEIVADISSPSPEIAAGSF
ncbi:unnamed protein product [Lathyrus sativus]|nr:unnamed protein product [Lathyrus sativus]